MAEFTKTEWIAARPNDVFNFILDPANASKVMPDVKSNQKLTDGPVGLGTRFRETRLMNGQETTYEIDVTRFDPPQHYSATSSQSGITTTFHYNLKPENDGTRIDLKAEVSGNGLKKLMVPMVIGFMKKHDGDHLQNLKSAVEKEL
ncbi:SRPBCC family protein [Chloroflexi bacterium TSY]|nr:SRPBCC family protein [Chloroflexi bacterium TSY]